MKLSIAFGITFFLAACTGSSNIEIEEIRDYNLIQPETVVESLDSFPALAAAVTYGSTEFIVISTDSPNVIFADAQSLSLKKSFWSEEIQTTRGVGSFKNKIFILKDSALLNYTLSGDSLFLTNYIQLNFEAIGLGSAVDPDILFIISAPRLAENSFKWEVFSLNANTGSIDTSPVFTIKSSEIRNFIDPDFLTNLSIDLTSYFSVSGKTFLEPDALAIHPVTKEIYVMSSLNNLLIIYRDDFSIREVAAFDKKIVNNPLNLYFLDKGDLFILDSRVNERLGLLRFPFRVEENL